MAKRLTMAEIDTILTLHNTGKSNREIAALLGKDRETIGPNYSRIWGILAPSGVSKLL